MVNKRTWTILNISLSFLIFLLILNLFEVSLPSLGNTIYAIDPADHICGVETIDGEFNQMGDLDRCCLESLRQLKCSSEVRELSIGKTNWLCKTSDKNPKHRLNNKAFHYCQQSPIGI